MVTPKARRGRPRTKIQPTSTSEDEELAEISEASPKQQKDKAKDSQSEKGVLWEKEVRREKEVRKEDAHTLCEKDTQQDERQERQPGTSTSTPRKRRQVVYSRDQENLLADYIEACPLIWKSSDPDHQNSELVNKAWQGAAKLSLMVGEPGECKDKLYVDVA